MSTKRRPMRSGSTNADPAVAQIKSAGTKRARADALIEAAVVDHPDTTSHELDSQLAHVVPDLQAPAAEGLAKRPPASPQARHGLGLKAVSPERPSVTPKPGKAAARGLKADAARAGQQSSTHADVSAGAQDRDAAPVAPANTAGTGTADQRRVSMRTKALASAPTAKASNTGEDAVRHENRSAHGGTADEPETAARTMIPPAPETTSAGTEPASVTAAQPDPAQASPSEPKPSAAAPAPAQPLAGPITMPDFDALAQNMGKFIDFSGKAAAAYLKPRETGEVKPSLGEEVVETFSALGRVAESWFANPTKMLQAQASLTSQLFGLWGDSLTRFSGTSPTQGPSASRKIDKRFASPDWQGTPMFDFLHQAYLVTTDWAKTMIDDAENVDPATREKAAFYLRQISSALSPANFLATNPELIKETFRENGENLVRGMQMLAEDIAAGKGELKIRQSDATKFKLGVDMASTPGKVVFRNDLMELIQYAPLTESVLKRPLLIVPPWINKFYVLDLNREKSFIRWMVSQGLTVFVISWVNPDERHAAKDWNAYMREGIFAALDAIEQAIGERDVTTVGYCVGGTLLSATLAYMAAKDDTRVSSSTLLTTQVDFKDAGDLKVFADEAQIRVIEQEMQNGGYLPGSKMANAFNMLRPDDLIWSYAVNTYIKGKPPAAFDLLAWNADSTRMSAANHAFYLRNCYLENRLTAGEMVIGGERLNLGAVTIPIYDLAAKEDHIAPARSVFNGAKFFGGPVRYVLAGSGHIAGVVNPPAKAKYQYWTGAKPDGAFEDWVASAVETKGTWWLDWIEWVKAQAPETTPAREPGSGGLPALGDAPGDYVRVQS